jgi:hypothetical protein
VPLCHIYNFFDDSNSSTYEESNFQDNYDNLVDDLNLNVFDDNLSLGRAQEQRNIDDNSNVDPTVMKLSDYHDDQDEQDNGGPHYWSEIKI